jgi:hypothetical protein
MIDPVSAFAIATSAYNAVRKGVEIGRELHEISGALGSFFGAVSDLRQAEEKASNPSVFKKLLNKGSVEKEALDNMVRKRTIMKQEYELMMLVKMTYGDAAYNEMIQERRKILDKRNKEKQLQLLRRKQLMENIFMYSLLALALYLLYLMLVAVYSVL